MIDTAYEEARVCFSNKAYTACDIFCRKILMNIAINKGADQNKHFKYYVDYLVTAGHITSDMKSWIDKIRKAGNDATHELASSDETSSEIILVFTVQLLKIIYEMAHKAKNTKTCRL